MYSIDEIIISTLNDEYALLCENKLNTSMRLKIWSRFSVMYVKWHFLLLNGQIKVYTMINDFMSDHISVISIAKILY